MLNVIMKCQLETIFKIVSDYSEKLGVYNM